MKRKLMKRKLHNKICCLFLLLCLFLSGCANVLTEQEDEEPGREAEQIQAVSGQVPDPVLALEPGAELELHTLEEFSFLEEGSSFAYKNLSDAEKIWYRDMEQILGSYGTEIELSGAALEAGLNETYIDRIFQCVLNDHPELFYVEGYSYTKYTRYGREDEILSIDFSGRYSVDYETAKQRYIRIQKAVTEILSGISDSADQYEKVKYVYDTVIRETDYQLDSADNQNIYSVFVNHLSVCQGYAKATQYLLNRLGMECALVLGQVQTGEGHAWNLVNIDGSYYYVDTTWGDVSYKSEEDSVEEQHTMPEINYDYLNVTTAELLRTHTLNQDQLMPECIAVDANYYVREGALFFDYDREQMSALFQRALEEDRVDVTIKCASQECYDKIFNALVEQAEIFDYLTGNDMKVVYSRNDIQLSLTFWVTNE